MLLTGFITPIVLAGSIRFRAFSDSGLFTFLLLVSQLVLLFAFSVINFFYFFVAFESILLPLFLMILVWGSRDRKIKSGFYFFMYTVVTSIGFLYVILLLGYEVGTTNIIDLVYFDKPAYFPERYWLFAEYVSGRIPTNIHTASTSWFFVIPLNKQLLC